MRSLINSSCTSACRVTSLCPPRTWYAPASLQWPAPLTTVQIAEDARVKVLTALPQIADVLVHVDPEDDEAMEDLPVTGGERLFQRRPPSQVENDVKKVRSHATWPSVVAVG